MRDSNQTYQLQPSVFLAGTWVWGEQSPKRVYLRYPHRHPSQHPAWSGRTASSPARSGSDPFRKPISPREPRNSGSDFSKMPGLSLLYSSYVLWVGPCLLKRARKSWRHFCERDGHESCAQGHRHMMMRPRPRREPWGERREPKPGEPNGRELTYCGAKRQVELWI